MADDITLSLPVGSGSVVAADNISSVFYQRIKLIHGADGVSAGDVALANGLPIQPATGATFAVTGTFWQATQPVSLAASVAVTGTFWQATQPVSVAAVVHVDDNAGSLTVDAPVGTPVFVRLSDGANPLATLPVSIAGSVAVTGTFWQATQPVSLASLPALAAGSAVIGHVIADASSAVIGHVIVDSGAIAATLSAETTKVIGTVNIASGQTVGLVAGVAEIGNVKNSGTFAVQATLAAETTKVIGTVNIAASQTVGLVAGTAVIGHVILDAGSAVIGHVIVDSGTVTTVSTVTSLSQFAGNAIDTNSGNKSAGTLRVVLATDQPQLTNKLLVTPDAGATVQAIPGTSGGLSISSFLSTAAVQSTAVKASAGQVYALEFFNIGSTPMYVRLYNMTTAPANTDTANIVWRGIIPGNTAGAGVVKTWANGLAFSTGIGMRCTGLIADNDNTALAASTVIGNIEYK